MIFNHLVNETQTQSYHLIIIESKRKRVNFHLKFFLINDFDILFLCDALYGSWRETC